MIVDLGNWAVYFGTAGWLLFAFLYGVMAPWWRSPIGRNVFSLAVVLAVVFGLISVQLIWGVSWPAREWVRLAIFAAIAATGWWRLYILLVDQIFAAPQTSRQPVPGKQGE